MTPRPPARETAEARGVVEVCAMPAKRIGCGILRRVVSGVERVGRGEVEDAIVEELKREGEKEIARFESSDRW